MFEGSFDLGVQGHGLVGDTDGRGWLDQMILEVFSSRNVSVILCSTDQRLEPELEKVMWNMWNKIDRAAIC